MSTAELESRILVEFELHHVAGIRECLTAGIDPNSTVKSLPLFQHLVTMYTRGPAFKDCLQTLIEFGLQIEDAVLKAVLTDDASALETLIAEDGNRLYKRYTFPCAFTPLREATLLHLCAEYNHLACAQVLLKYGHPVDAKAGIDAFGFGAQTPIFHTVNQHNLHGLEMLKYLLTFQPDLQYTVKGLIWGEGFEWETYIPMVNPVSYAMMGLFRQFQRREDQIYQVVDLMMQATFGLEYHPGNVPNKYLYGSV